jgi:hypothetical protein
MPSEGFKSTLLGAKMRKLVAPAVAVTSAAPKQASQKASLAKVSLAKVSLGK